MMSINSRPLTKRWIPGKGCGEEMSDLDPKGPVSSFTFVFKVTPCLFNPVSGLVSGSPTVCHKCPYFVTTAFSLFPVFVCSYVPTFLLAPVSSLRLKYVYKSAGVKDEANTTKRASLIESLTNSEVNLISFTLKFRGKSNLLHVLDRYGSFN